jgi:hypothetical protein
MDDGLKCVLIWNVVLMDNLIRVSPDPKKAILYLFSFFAEDEASLSERMQASSPKQS